MNYRLDRYGNRISLLVFGCMRLPQTAGIINKAEAEKQIMAAYNSGINYFDTAYIYPGSESAIGEIFEKNGIRKNINIATGVTIGQENRGKRKGCPTIGDNVWIGTNSVIVGNIKIGNDVLIAPLAFVNFDVPDHSVVIGNPARIIFKENATEGYINKTV